MNAFRLLLQMLLALVLVLALMWAAVRLLAKVNTGRTGGLIELMARQPVGRTSSVAIVRVADRALVVGVTEDKVSLLTEADLDYLEAMQAEEEEKRAARIPVDGRQAGGSILSPSTWKRALEAIKDRTARR